MKKLFNYALIGAIALTGPTMLTSCSSSDDAAAENTNPNFNPETNEVTAQFVFNVASGSTATTRQSGAATQVSSSLTADQFRGIDNSHVMCFINGAGDGKYLTTAATATKSFDMARVANAGTLSNTKSSRVLEMSLPLNTNTMVFYGKAIDETNNYNTFGHLDAFNVDDNLASTYFQLGRRLTAENKAEFQEIQKLLAACLTCVMGVKRGTEAVSADDAPTGVTNKYTFAIASNYMPDMRWKAYFKEKADPSKTPLTPTSTDEINAKPLEEKLYRVYKELTTIQTAELRNASGYAIKESVRNLWSIVNSVRCALPTNIEEALAKYMAHLIDQELRKYFEAESVPNDGGSVTGVSIKSSKDLIDALSADPYWPAEATSASPAINKPGSNDFPTIYNDAHLVSSDKMGQFPGQYNLPQGSTHILFDPATCVFTYAQTYNSSAVGDGTFTVDDYYYPAELCYFGNSALRVSDDEHVVSQYPANVTAWNDNGSWTGWTTDGHVQSSTRSVAMKYDINYGTSLLKTTVSYKTQSLQDNNKKIQQRDYGVTEANKTINVTGESFKLVGIIVGDQWPKVGWDFLPKTTDPGNTSYRKGYIYDNQITNNGVIPASTTSASDPNYTLVFDNYQDFRSSHPTNKQPKVYVALEFQNNSGVDFFGFDNMIPNGGNFYLIGELDPTSMNGPALPQWHALPPYDATQYGNTGNTVPRVFIQDHMTTANFKFDTYSLQHAYLTVPDLRSSSVTLGLSVDLQWSTGLTFDNITIGGNEVPYTPNP